MPKLSHTLLLSNGTALSRPNQLTQQRLSNVSATRLLKQLYSQPQNQTHNASASAVLGRAFEICDALHGAPNHFTLNTMLKLCAHFGSSPHIDRVSCLSFILMCTNVARVTKHNVSVADCKHFRCQSRRTCRLK